MFVISRVLMELWVGFDSPTHILVLDEVGEFVWPSIRVVVLADLGLRVAVLTSAGVRVMAGRRVVSGCAAA